MVWACMCLCVFVCVCVCVCFVCVLCVFYVCFECIVSVLWMYCECIVSVCRLRESAWKLQAGNKINWCTVSLGFKVIYGMTLSLWKVPIVAQSPTNSHIWIYQFFMSCDLGMEQSPTYFIEVGFIWNACYIVLAIWVMVKWVIYWLNSQTNEYFHIS